MHGLCKAPRFLEIRMRGFTPDQVSVWSVGNAACNGRLESSANSEETFGGPFAGDELTVARIDVAGHQMSAVGIGARHNERRHA